MAAAILHVCSSPEREVDVGIGVPPNGRGSAEAPESSSSSGGCRSGMSSEAENDMATTRIRFAPTDSTLPVPWKALLGVVDGHEHVYFWNPVTNVTQYEKPQSSVTEGDAHATRNPIGVEINKNGADWSAAASRSTKVHRSHDGDSSRGIKRPCTGESPDSFKRPRSVVSYPRVDSSPEINAYKKKHEITAQGDNVPHPYVSFDSTSFPSTLLQELKAAGFTAPSPIQAQSWPIAQQGRDLVAIAKTGSGKTLGYLVPAFLHLRRYRDPAFCGPNILVLAPTRELVIQIQSEAKKFGNSSNISSTCVYGGADKRSQLQAIGRGVDIIVATPGRLNDFLKARTVSLQRVSYVVLDEADRMLDMGFEPQIRAIFSQLPAERQSLMFTATWPREIRSIAGELLSTPVQINIGSTDDLAANKAIIQHVEVIKRFDKQRRLEQILKSQDRDSRILVFSSTKRMCDQLARNLNGFKAAAIHGDKSQEDREFTLSQFRSGKSPVLVATDVAARGLDVKDIRVVINYDFPTKFEDYIHRIGRTGRGGATGTAYTFFDGGQDAKFSKKLVKVLEGANQKVPKALADIAARGGNF
ncbi:ATP-dependent RNA helicase DDX5/DBP2 [Marchantia polymorpha subsp. ruderalis]|uniref:RNA helicase n=2 Tax=Marchantia polymorpha TaxID=3197 RepID=A0A176W2U3_MARPO|nr:hypothetical protein AXG93_441s1200 [Marchantia polymorpha subsp. ruderalis]PTQ37112.1 hypothetical protein MARPO_0059s0052 [Marchantia polymorpha]BBN14610.1 hypothetical protein Mp_6g12960 [Marchantia polymorpha subsp. ruderalis]|eukprot:PTQ37112.1 hypothetical protein MARPO_0059s0052 [Marchantia polymorpha]